MGSRIVFTLIAFLFAVLSLNAQSGYEAQIRGTITDPSGALVIGANVTLVNTSTGVPLKTKTNEKGLYTFNGLRPDKYDLLVESSGFRRAESKDIVLAVSQQAVIDVALQIGTVAASVDVTEA